MQEIVCTHYVHPERVELGYDYCVMCASRMPNPKPRCIVIGQHKGPDLVVSIDSAPSGSLYNRNN